MYPKKFNRVIRTSEAVIEAFLRHKCGLDLLARYYWLKVNFTSSFLRETPDGAAQRLGVSRRTVERTIDMLLEHGLAWADGRGHRLYSKRQLDQKFVPVLQKKRLLHSCTLCIKEGADWKDIKDLLQLKLLEQHARKTYFWARKEGKLNSIIGSAGQRTERIDAAHICELQDGVSLGVHIPMTPICKLFTATAKTVRAWRKRMEKEGYIRTTKSFQAVTRIGKGTLGPVNHRALEILKETQPEDLLNHSFLTKGGTIMQRKPLIFEFLAHPVYHTRPKRPIPTME